jgi:hypothetical protein
MAAERIEEDDAYRLEQMRKSLLTISQLRAHVVHMRLRDLEGQVRGTSDLVLDLMRKVAEDNGIDFESLGGETL